MARRVGGIWRLFIGSGVLTVQIHEFEISVQTESVHTNNHLPDGLQFRFDVFTYPDLSSNVVRLLSTRPSLIALLAGQPNARSGFRFHFREIDSVTAAPKLFTSVGLGSSCKPSAQGQTA